MNSYTLIDLLIKMSLVQIVALGILYLLKNRKASVRYQFMRISLLLMIILPIISIYSEQSKIVLIETEIVGSSDIILSDNLMTKPQAEVKPFSKDVAIKTNQHPKLKANPNNSNSFINNIKNPYNWLLFYLIVISAFVLRFIIGSKKLIHFRTKLIKNVSLDTILKKLNIHRNVQLFLSDKSISPMTWGLINPKIIIPNESRTWDSKMMEMTLLHESIHIKRFDYFLNMISYFVLCLLWFNPISYFYYSRFRVEQEASCDENVVVYFKSDLDYANHLIHIAKMLVTKRNFLQPGVHMLNKNELSKRIKEILNTKRSLSPILKVTLLLPFLIMITVTTMSFKTIAYVEAENSKIKSEPIKMFEKDKKDDKLATKEDIHIYQKQESEFTPTEYPIARVKFNYTAEFGKKISPFGKELMHKGLDIACAKGTDVYATASGIISSSGENGDWGLQIVITHSNQANRHDFITRYSHLNEIDVKEGQRVKKGDKIGEVGNTGLSTSSHLHYEVEFKGELVNPKNYLPHVKRKAVKRVDKKQKNKTQEIKRTNRNFEAREARLERVAAERERVNSARVNRQNEIKIKPKKIKSKKTKPEKVKTKNKAKKKDLDGENE